MNAFNRMEMQVLSMARIMDAAYFPASDQVLETIMAQRFGVEYQPIVGVQSSEVEGYQASARFWDKNNRVLPVEEVFACLRQNPLLLFHTELELKKQQIAQLPAEGWLMLDLDVESFLEGGESADNPFLALFRPYAWTERELIINLVGYPDADVDRLQLAIELLQQSGTALALKQMTIRCGSFSLSSFLDARMVKFDRVALSMLTQDAAQTMVEWLVSAARRVGVQTIMSGIHDCEQLEWARKLGVDNVQGRLFERQAMRASRR